MSDFMQRQVTRNCNWIRVETTHGTFFLEGGLAFVRNSEQKAQPLTEEETEKYAEILRPYVDGEPQEWENIKGYGARLSAPGYLDCTEWAVFESPEEAEAYLNDNYPEDEDEEEAI